MGRAGGDCAVADSDVSIAANPLDATDTQPMLSRSEGFAEDLFDSHPSH